MCFFINSTSHFWAHLFCVIINVISVPLVIWWFPRGWEQGLCLSHSLLYPQHLSQSLTHRRSSANECMDGWMMWEERLHWVDAVVLSKHLLLLEYSVGCAKHPICLPSRAHKLLESRNWVISSSPESGLHWNSMEVCRMRNEWRMNGEGLAGVFKHAWEWGWRKNCSKSWDAKDD